MLFVLQYTAVNNLSRNKLVNMQIARTKYGDTETPPVGLKSL